MFSRSQGLGGAGLDLIVDGTLDAGRRLMINRNAGTGTRVCSGAPANGGDAQRLQELVVLMLRVSSSPLWRKLTWPTLVMLAGSAPGSVPSAAAFGLLAGFDLVHAVKCRAIAEFVDDG